MNKILYFLLAFSIGSGLLAAEFPSVPASAISISVSGDRDLTDTEISQMVNAPAVAFKGSGTITATKSLASGSCPVHVTAGVTFRSTFAGPTAKATGAFYVHSGASIFADNQKGTFYADNGSSTTPNGDVHLQGGDGADGKGAQYLMGVFGTSESMYNVRLPLANKTTLYGDSTAMIVLPESRDGAMLVADSRTIDLQGHFLTWRGNARDVAVCVDDITDSNPDGGGFIVDAMKFIPRGLGTNTMVGDGELRFVNGGVLSFSEVHRLIRPIGWKVNWTEGEGTLYTQAFRDDVVIDPPPYPNSTYCRIGGTFTLLSDLVLTNKATSNAKYVLEDYCPIAFEGKITGAFGIDGSAPNGGNNEKWWAISLMNPENDFTGGMKLNTDYLQLFANGALPAEGGKLEAVDTIVELLPSSLGDWQLPEADFIATMDGVSAVRTTGSSIGGSWRGVTKHGAGTLSYRSLVGGKLLDVAEGTVEIISTSAEIAGLYAGQKYFGEYIPSASTAPDHSDVHVSAEPPPLNKSINHGCFHVTNEVDFSEDKFNYNDLMDAANLKYGFPVRQNFDFDTGTVHWDDGYVKLKNTSISVPLPTVTNSTAKGPVNAFMTGSKDYTSALRYSVYSYTGYIWNNERKNVTWTLASSLNQYYKIRINDQTFARTKNWNPNNEATTVAQAQGQVYKVTLKPGPNPITICLINQYVGNETATGLGLWRSIASQGFTNWSTDLGLAYAKSDLSSAASKDGKNYKPLMDDGAGSLFTVCEDLGDMPMPEFDEILVEEGATLRCRIAGDASYRVKGISGGGKVEGNIAIHGALIVSNDAVMAGSRLTVDGTVTFAGGATVFGSEKLPNSPSGEWVVLSASRIIGCPTIDPASPLAGFWKVKVDGSVLKLVSCVSVGGDTLDATGGKVKYAVSSFASVAGLNKGEKWFADWSCPFPVKDSKKLYLSDVDPQGTGLKSHGSGYFHVTNTSRIAEFDYNNEAANAKIGYKVEQWYNWDNSIKYTDFYDSTVNVTNAVVNCPDVAFESDYGQMQRAHVFTYAGYIWNLEDEPKTWTFASSWNAYHRIWINGVKVSDQVRNLAAANGPTGEVFKATLNPGPNPISIRSWNWFVSDGNYQPNATNRLVNWGWDLGFAYITQDSESRDGNDYTPLKDPGDGSLFTTEITGVESPTYNTLVLGGPGSAVEFSPRPTVPQEFAFDNIEGAGDIMNGENVQIGQTITIVEDELKAGRSLKIRGKVTLAPGVKIKVKLSEGSDTLSRTYSPIVVLESDELVLTSGLPAYEGPDPDKWTVVRVGDKILLKCATRGSRIIFR